MGNNLWQDSTAGDVAKVATLLAAQDLQSFLSYQNCDGFTALYAATANNDLDVTRLLIVKRREPIRHLKVDVTARSNELVRDGHMPFFGCGEER